MLSFVQFTNEKSHLISICFIAAVWDKSATLALLSLYEVKKDMLDNPKKKTKIWDSISVDLQQDFGIQVCNMNVQYEIL